MTSVTILGDTYPLGQNFNTLWLFLVFWANVYQLKKFSNTIGPIFVLENGPILSTRLSHLVTLSKSSNNNLSKQNGVSERSELTPF